MHRDKLRIGIAGLTSGAGAGFIAANLARMLSERRDINPTILELNEHGLYDCLAMDKHFAGREFFDFFGAINDDRSIRRIANLLCGINWALKIPGYPKNSIDYYKMIRMINNISGDAIISVIRYKDDKGFWELIRNMDAVLIIIDPLPSMLLSGHKFLCSLRTSNLPLIYVVNKMNGGVSRKDLLGYLKIKKLHFIPLIEPELVYSAEYSCKFLYDLPRVNSVIRHPLESIVKDILMHK